MKPATPTTLETTAIMKQLISTFNKRFCTGLLALGSLAFAQVNVNLPDLAPGESVTVRFRVQVDSNLNSTQIVNQASISGNNFATTQSRDPDIPPGPDMFIPFPTFTSIELPPLTIDCPSNVTVECGSDTSTNALGSATYADGTGCTNGMPVLSFTDSSLISTGTITRTWQIANGCGNTSTCEQLITVVDTTPPQITPPSNLVTCVDSGSCSTVVNFPSPQVSDCDTNLVIAFNPASGQSFSAGTRTIEVVATDGSGNSSTSSFDLVVNDCFPPTVVSCPTGAVLVADNNCQARIPEFRAEPLGPVITAALPAQASFADNCTDAFTLDVTQLPAPDTVISGVGTTLVSVIATDEAGLSTTCSFDVVVVDQMPPVITCPADATIECNADSSPTSLGVATAVDSCDINPQITFVDSASTGLCANASVISRTWTATDASGNSASCTQTVNVVDTTAPLFTCPSNIVVCTDSNLCSAIVTFPTVTATDNCDVSPTVVYTPPSGSSFSLGTNSVSAVASDACGNSVTCSFDVVVSDCQAPLVAYCPTNALELVVDSTCTATLPDFTVSDQGRDGIPGAEAIFLFQPPFFIDNCTPSFQLALAQTPAPLSAIGLGTTSVSVVATDLTGNSATCIFEVVTTDITAPVITCPADTSVECSDDTSPATTGMATATDNCDSNPAITFSDSVSTGRCANVSQILRSWTATDASGNSSSCTQTIDVVDFTAPVITCPPDMTVTNDAGQEGAIVSFSVTASDNCDSSPAVVSSTASGSLFPLGTTTVTNSVTDACGNSSHCTFNVTVLRPVDLSVSKVANPDPVYSGNTLTYTITVSNAGPREARNVVVVDTLPDHLSLSGDLFILLDDLPANSSTSFSFNADVTLPTNTVSVILTNLVSVSSSDDEVNPLDNTNTLETTAFGLAQLTLLDDPNGYGTITGASNGLHLIGSVFDLYPLALLDKFGFDYWETNGVNAGSSVPLNLTLLGDTTVQVFFKTLFIDVTEEVTGTLSNWEVDFSTGIFYSDLTICNTATVDVHLIEPFWYAYPSNATQFLIGPDGMTNGVPYVDITAKVNAALPSIGNNDMSLDTNECVTIEDIAWYQLQLVPFTGSVFAVYADPPGDPNGDPSLRDTDRDGLPNFWEDRHGLNKNHAFDGKLDSDLDGASNDEEFDADTLPGDPASRLQMREIRPGQRLRWQGGREVDQFLEWAPTPNGPWTTILTNQAPTEVEENLDFPHPQESEGFYRIRVGTRASGDVQ